MERVLTQIMTPKFMTKNHEVFFFQNPHSHYRGAPQTQPFPHPLSSLQLTLVLRKHERRADKVCKRTELLVAEIRAAAPDDDGSGETRLSALKSSARARPLDCATSKPTSGDMLGVFTWSVGVCGGAWDVF